MAVQIPTATGPTQRTRALGAPQIRITQETSQFQGLVEPLARAAGQIWQKTQDDADQSALIEAESQLSKWKLNTMFAPDNGVYNRKGKNALDITNQTMPQFEQQADQLGNSLTNDRQRERWQQIVSGQRNSLSNELNRYEFGERQVYYKQADAASLQASAEGAMAYYQDPGQVAYYQNKGARILAAQGEREGAPPEATELKIREYASGINMSVITRLTASDPIQAQRYYAQSMKGMTVEDQLRATKLLSDSVRQQLGSQIGTKAYDFGTGGDDSLSNLIIQAESSGDPTAVSPKGAKGLMQLMPDTAKEMAGELGIPYDEERLTSDPNYNMALGNAYLNKMLGRYSGNATLAVAAYNAGPGSVDKWIKENGDPRTDEINAKDWIDKIPFGETRAYTSKIVGQMAPTKASSKLAAATSWIERNIDDPDTRKFALDRVDDLHKADELEAKARYDEAAEIALSRGYNAIPAPMLQEIGAEERVKLQKLDEQRRKGIEPPTDEAKLREFLSMPGPQFAELSLSRDMRPYLNDADYKTVSSAWQKAVSGDFSDQRAQKAQENRLQLVMAQAGILTGASQKAMEPKNLAMQQQFRAAYQDRKDAFFLSHDRQPTAAEADDLANSLLIDVRLRGTGVFSEDTVSLWKVAPEQMADAYVDAGDVEIEQIPAMDRSRIVATLRSRGEPASEENIIALYIQGISDLGVTAR